jgi:hypothetical protein
MPPAGVHAVFPDAPPRAGLYESFYLRAVAPDRPLGVWIRYTVHKRGARAPGDRAPGGRTPGDRAPSRQAALQGSVWCTVFDGERERPFQHKLTTDALSVPPGEWIAVGDSWFGPTRAEGTCGAASWSLRFASREPELRHLPRAFLYRAPVPRTKLTSPAPAARFEGTLVLAERTIELDGWRGAVGHNWGAEHAERWIWLHGVGFQEEPGAWIDVAIGRARVARRTTPWVACGALSLDGAPHRLGGFGAGRRSLPLLPPTGVAGLRVAETPARCALSLPGAGGLVVEAHAQAPPGAIAGWRYADPDGGGHDVSNCSIAALTLIVRRPGRPARTLRTAHGAVYELGMRERDHGVPIAPFTDGG